MNDWVLCYIKYDQGGVIMDVINPEQVRVPALPCPFYSDLNGTFLRLRLVLLRKLARVPSWPLRGSPPTLEQKVWLPSIFSQTGIS